MKLLAVHASYHCPSCHYVVAFEHSNESRSIIRKDGTVIGACMERSCEHFEKRFKIVLPVIEVEEMPRQARTVKCECGRCLTVRSNTPFELLDFECTCGTITKCLPA